MGIGNDRQGREARQRRCSGKSQREPGRREEGRALLVGDIGKSHITTSVRKVHAVALLCPRVANKHAFERMRGEFRKGRRVILDK